VFSPWRPAKPEKNFMRHVPVIAPTNVGITVQRHIRAGGLEEREGRIYATSTAAEQ